MLTIELMRYTIYSVVSHDIHCETIYVTSCTPISGKMNHSTLRQFFKETKSKASMPCTVIEKRRRVLFCILWESGRRFHAAIRRTTRA